MVYESPKVENRLLEVAWANVTAALEHVKILGKKSALEKVCSFLLLMAGQTVDITTDEIQIHLPMPRADIADFLGLSSETISRCFSRLQCDGLIVIDSHYLVRINNPKALAACYDYI
jgi:CRP/FNR family transcriptional regulator